jgi:hypothetical protein
LLVAGVLARFVYLGSDPAYYAWAGYLTDEGRWTQQAREIALFGSPDLQYWLAVVHLAIAPLFQAAVFVAFKLFGVGLASARLVSAICGSLLVVAIWRYLRPRLTTGGTLVAVVAVALQPDLIFLSRVAIPEMPVMLFELLAFGILVTGPRSTARALVGGLVMAAGLGFKGTDLPIVLVLAAVVAAVHEPDDPSPRWAKVTAFLGAIGGSAALVLLAAPLLVGQDILPSVADSWPSVARFRRVAGPFAMATFLFRGVHATALNVFLLGCWLIGGLLLCAGALPRLPARALYVGSAVWAAAWIGVATAVEYFPERYVFHVLVPLAVNLGAGCSLLQSLGGGGIRGAIARVGGTRRLACAAWLALPCAVVATPFVIDVARLAGLEVASFTQQVAMIVALTVLGASVAYRGWTPATVLYALCAAPAVVVALWLLGPTFGLVRPAFWPEEGASGFVPWLLLLGLGGAGAWALATWSARARRAPEGAALLAAALGLVGMAQSAPGLLRPTYTLRAAAEAIESSLGVVDVVWTHRAASVFLANGIKYREVDDTAPDVVVSMFSRMPAAVDVPYQVVAEYRIRLGDAYMRRNPEVDPLLRVLRRAP